MLLSPRNGIDASITHRHSIFRDFVVFAPTKIRMPRDLDYPPMRPVVPTTLVIVIDVPVQLRRACGRPLRLGTIPMHRVAVNCRGPLAKSIAFTTCVPTPDT